MRKGKTKYDTQRFWTQYYYNGKSYEYFELLWCDVSDVAYEVFTMVQLSEMIAIAIIDALFLNYEFCWLFWQLCTLRNLNSKVFVNVKDS